MYCVCIGCEVGDYFGWVVKGVQVVGGVKVDVDVFGFQCFDQFDQFWCGKIDVVFDGQYDIQIGCVVDGVFQQWYQQCFVFSL